MATQGSLLQSLGFRNSPRRTGRNETVLQDFSMSPYPASNQTKSRFPSHHPLPNSSRLSNSNRENINSLNQSSTQSLLWSSPKRSKGALPRGKYSQLPTKSSQISGLGMVSPVPSQVPHKLELSSHNGSLLQADGPISPIRGGMDQTLPLNQSMNVSAISNVVPSSNSQNNETRMSVHRPNVNVQAPPQTVVGGQAIQHDTQITIIGFPAGEASFIHRKFASYGTILKSEWSHNALFLEYEGKQSAGRSLEENARWISNGNLRYMIAVMYAETTEMNEHGPEEPAGRGGRFLNVTQMYNNRYNNQGPGNGRSYLRGNYNDIEKAPDIQMGPTHVFWKVFNFMTSGW